MITRNLKLGTGALQIKTEWNEFEKMIALYSEFGGKIIDTAMNYPINSNHRDFRTTLDGLMYRNLNGCGLQIKLGAVKNDRSDSSFLSRSYLTFQRDWIIAKSKNPIVGFGIHWDNRDSKIEVLDTVDFILDTLQLGYEVTLSGIKNPILYSKYLEKRKINFQLRIEDSQARKKGGQTHLIRDLFPLVQIEYYGLFGGLARKRLVEDTTHTIESLKIESDFKCNLVIGPRNCEQLIYYKELME
jgi:hypothetical protein